VKVTDLLSLVKLSLVAHSLNSSDVLGVRKNCLWRIASIEGVDCDNLRGNKGRPVSLIGGGVTC